MFAFCFPRHYFLQPSLTWCHSGVRWWCNQPTNQPTNQPIDQPTINQPTHLARARRLLEWLEVFGCMPNPRCTRSCNNLSLIQRPRILFKCSNLWIRKKSSSPELDFQKYKYWKIYFISQHFAEIPTRSVIMKEFSMSWRFTQHNIQEDFCTKIPAGKNMQFLFHFLTSEPAKFWWGFKELFRLSRNVPKDLSCFV